MVTLKDIIKKMSAGESLSEEEAFDVIESFLAKDGATDAQISAYLFATSLRIPSAAELIGAARSLRSHMQTVDLEGLAGAEQSLDTCGTGGSGLDPFNTSTAAAFICAAAGCLVAKHGNRAGTSRSGSADVLEALGVRVNLDPAQAKRCLEKTNFVFLFAPQYHSATKRVAQIRREIGVRTIFNFLGPLLNPAKVRSQLLGVPSLELLPLMAEALRKLGTARALVVCGEDGLDEITLCGETHALELRGGRITPLTISPESCGCPRAEAAAIRGLNPEQSAYKIREIFAGERSPYRDLVAMNAGAALYAAGKAGTVEEGVRRAERIIDCGEALEALNKAIKYTPTPEAA